MFFIKTTDATTGKDMLIRGDLIFKIEEDSSMGTRCITFSNGNIEYVLDTMEELIQALKESYIDEK